ncbi:MAG: Uncharacterized protein CEN88_392, partial [Candidatus Berkelbacteria bacterium Licking1014_2]
MKLKIDFRWRHFLLFLAVGTVFAGGWWGFEAWQRSRATSELDTTIPYQGSYWEIAIDRQGNISSPLPQKPTVIFGRENDVFKQIVIEESGYYLPEAKVKLALPKALGDWQVKPRVYAIHGIESANFEISDEMTVNFIAKDIGAAGIFTIETTFPKGYLEPSWSKQIAAFFVNLSIKNWLLAAAVFPAIAWLIVLLAA